MNKTERLDKYKEVEGTSESITYFTKELIKMMKMWKLNKGGELETWTMTERRLLINVNKLFRLLNMKMKLGVDDDEPVDWM